MHRRQLLQTLNAMGASIVLPAAAFDGDGISVTTPTTQPVNTPANAAEVNGYDRDIPKFGVVAVGGLGGAILNALTVRLPYLTAIQLPNCQ